MNDSKLDDKILNAVREGAGSREKLMQIEALRISTWAVIGERLNVMTKRGTLIASKAGWRLSK